MRHRPDEISRRSVLAGAVGILVLPLAADGALATPETMVEAMDEVLGKGAKIKPGRVKIELPELAENGNSVPLNLTVDSPMTAADHVKAVYVFSEKNPVSNVVRFHLGPRSGRASFATRARIADTGTVTAIAQLSDGSFWSDSVQVVVTLSACLEDGLI